MLLWYVEYIAFSTIRINKCRLAMFFIVATCQVLLCSKLVCFLLLVDSCLFTKKVTFGIGTVDMPSHVECDERKKIIIYTS